jgi:outer membrane protein OmpA-like peptidoglycan-associated protein
MSICIVLLAILLQNCHVLVVNMENKKYYPEKDYEVFQKYGTVIWGKFEVSSPKELSCQEGIRSITIQRTVFDFIVHYIIGGIYTARTIEATCNLSVTNSEISKSFLENKKLSLNSVYFNKNSSDILPESFQVLNEVVKVLNSEKFSKLIIIGHTDLLGVSDQNLLLSKKRAEAVKTYLSAKGLSVSKIQTKGMGSNSPLFNSIDEESNRKNRRIEFQLE